VIELDAVASISNDPKKAEQEKCERHPPRELLLGVPDAAIVNAAF
jgi:hypothetical protein